MLKAVNTNYFVDNEEKDLNNAIELQNNSDDGFFLHTATTEEMKVLRINNNWRGGHIMLENNLPPNPFDKKKSPYTRQDQLEAINKLEGCSNHFDNEQVLQKEASEIVDNSSSKKYAIKKKE